MFTRTKFICTIGPAVNSPEKVKQLIHAGMNVARLNFSHGTHEEHAKMIQMLKMCREELNVPLAIMLDTKGPEIRIGEIKGGSCYLSQGDRWHLLKEICVGDEKKVTVRPPHVLDHLSPGMKVLFDNGYIESVVVDKTKDGVIVEILDGGTILSGKGINVPDSDLHLEVLNEKDLSDIIFGCQMDIDIIAASFVRSAEHIVVVREILKEQKKQDIWVIAKIENREGVNNLDNILQVSDGIMVARGDLGVEVPLTEVPKLQKMMIRKSVLSGKPAVTATHMLESMILNSRPTRAETSDVANAIYDSTSAVMLSGETAIGKYPEQAIKVMKSIVYETEQDFEYNWFFNQHSELVYNDVPSAVTLASVKTAYSSNAKAIFAFTQSGGTPRLLARLRPKMPIIAMTPKRKCYHQLAFLWGVIPFYSEDAANLEEAFDRISHFALEKEIVSYGDLVIVNAGQPFGYVGTTNMMLVEHIGDVLIRGEKSRGKRVHGNVIILLSPEQMEPYKVRGRILVITSCDSSYIPFIENASAVILQNHIDDIKSEEFLLSTAEDLEKPVIARADDSVRILSDGQLVTLDPIKHLVYKGVVI